MWAATPGIHLRWLPGARIEFPYRERTLDAEFGTGPSGPMSGLVGGSRGSFGVMTDERPLPMQPNKEPKKGVILVFALSPFAKK